MSITQMILIAGGVAFGFMAILLIALLWQPWKYISKNTAVGQKNRYRIAKVYGAFAQKVYAVLYKFYPTQVTMINLSAMFKHMYVLDDEQSKIKAVSLIIKEIIVGIVAYLISVVYFDDTLLALIMAYMLMQYAYYKFRGDGYKFLVELEEMIGDMVHMYNAEQKNIDRMFMRILDDKDSYMYKYMDQMYTYLKRASLDVQSHEAINEYNTIATSRHLRLIFNYLYITYRYGDEVTATGEDLFNHNMLAIQREIHSDVAMLTQIKDATMGEQWFIMIGVAIIPGATYYMKEYFTFDGFEAINRFLNSSFGYSIKLACAVFALICYYIYMKLMDSNVALEFHKEVSWEEQVLHKNRKLRDLIDFLAPKEKTKKREKLELEVQMTEGYVGVRPLYLKKMLFGVVISLITVFLLSVDTYTNYTSIVNDLHMGVNTTMMDQVIAAEQFPDEYKSKSLSNDMLVIDILKENPDEYFSLVTVAERQAYIIDVIKTNKIDYGLYYEIAAQRIVEKYTQLEQINIGTLLIVVIVAFIGAYNLPNLAMKLNLLLNKGALIHNEVNGYYTVVVLLVNHSASNVYMIISWLASFARIFKARLQLCKDNLSEREILKLGEGITYKPFSRLIECIQMAYKGADLRSAFAGIEQKHMFQEESRRLMNEQIVKKKVRASELLSWCAMGFTFVMYIMLPMLMAIVEMLTQVL